MRLRDKLAWYRAQEWLRRYQPQIIAVGGTTGKTTAKSAITLALSGQRYVRMAAQPYELPLDVALAILGLDEASKRPNVWQLITGSIQRELAEAEPDTLVLEFGAQAPGAMDWLSTQLQPDISLMLQVGTHNLELFTSKDMVAHELTSLAVSTKAEGIVVLNNDDEYVARMSEHVRSKTITFGRDRKNTIQLEHIERLAEGGLAAHLFIANKRYSLSLPKVVSEKQVGSVLGALGVVLALNGNVAQAVKNLQKFTPPPGRLEKVELPSGALLLDDSFHATPESMTEALKTLAALTKRRERAVAVLGSIPNLAARSEFLHKQLGRLAAEVADLLILVGPEMRHAATAALLTKETDVHHFLTTADAAHWLPGYLEETDTILVCGPRQEKLEQLTQALGNL